MLLCYWSRAEDSKTVLVPLNVSFFYREESTREIDSIVNGPHEHVLAAIPLSHYKPRKEEWITRK